MQGKEDPKFTTLLVARFNLIPELNRLIDREIALADEGKQGRIIKALSWDHCGPNRMCLHFHRIPVKCLWKPSQTV